MRANIFRAPVERTLVDELVDAGYDVWLENWRASIDLAPNEWTLDQAAEHDHPAAVQKVVEETGADELKAVIHCQGSTSFMMSAVAGLVPEVTTIVANAVSLHPVVPRLSRFKLSNVVPLVARLTPYMNPQWGLSAPNATAKALALMVRITHHECDNAVCKMVSFTYGTGFPALWRHENLNPATHEWVEAGVRPRAAVVLPPDGGAASRRGGSSPRTRATPCRATTPRSRLRPTRVSRSSPAARTSASCPRASVGPIAGSRRHRPGGHTLRRAARLRPSRRVHGPERGARRLPADAGRARAMKALGLMPRRLKRQHGRHALVDGIPFALPVRSFRMQALMAAFGVDTEQARTFLPPSMSPVRLWDRALLVITVVNYQDTSIGKYIEYSVALTAARRDSDPPRLLPLLLPGPFRFGQYVVDLPVSSEVSVKGGKGIWGMPKHQANLDFVVEEGRVSSQYDKDGRPASTWRSSARVGRACPCRWAPRTTAPSAGC